jgi:hypothetical protein
MFPFPHRQFMVRIPNPVREGLFVWGFLRFGATRAKHYDGEVAKCLIPIVNAAFPVCPTPTFVTQILIWDGDYPYPFIFLLHLCVYWFI